MKADFRAPENHNSCVVITDAAELASLETEWNDLWTRAKGSVYQSYALAFHSWNDIARPAGRSLFCIVVREEGKMALVFPLVRYRKGPFWMLRPLGPDTAEVADILYDPASDYRAHAMLAWRMIEKTSNTDIVDMPYVRIGSVLDHLIQQTRKFTREHDLAPFAYLRDEQDWDHYQKQVFSPATRKQLRRKRKRLSELGDFKMVSVDPVAERSYAAELVQWMFLHKQSWGAKVGKQGAWMSSDNYWNFIRNWITDGNNGQTIRLHAILIDETPVAVTIVSYCLSHVDLIIAGFHSNPHYAKHSPGLVLDDLFMKIAFDKRLNVDFGVGGEPYKLMWSKNRTTELASYRIPTSVIGTAATQLWWLKHKAVSHIADQRKRYIEARQPAASAPL